MCRRDVDKATASPAAHKRMIVGGAAFLRWVVLLGLLLRWVVLLFLLSFGRCCFNQPSTQLLLWVVLFSSLLPSGSALLGNGALSPSRH